MKTKKRVKGEEGGLEGWIQTPLAQRVSRREELLLGRELTSTSLRSSRTLTPYHNTTCLPGSTGNPPPLFVSPFFSFSLSLLLHFLSLFFLLHIFCFSLKSHKIGLCVHSCTCVCTTCVHTSLLVYVRGSCIRKDHVNGSLDRV